MVCFCSRALARTPLWAVVPLFATPHYLGSICVFDVNGFAPNERVRDHRHRFNDLHGLVLILSKAAPVAQSASCIFVRVVEYCFLPCTRPCADALARIAGHRGLICDVIPIILYPVPPRHLVSYERARLPSDLHITLETPHALTWDTLLSIFVVSIEWAM